MIYEQHLNGSKHKRKAMIKANAGGSNEVSNQQQNQIPTNSSKSKKTKLTVNLRQLLDATKDPLIGNHFCLLVHKLFSK